MARRKVAEVRLASDVVKDESGEEEETEEERCPAAMWAETDLKSGSG